MKNLKNIIILNIFDFDNTLMRTPVRKIGIKMWEDHYKTKYPSKNWWGRPESLDPMVFNDYIKPNNSILSEFKKDINKKNVWTIMLTHRLPELSNIVEYYLNLFNIKFDDYLYRRSFFLSKADDINDYIPKFPNLKEINIWEDRKEEIDIIKKWAYKVEPWLNIDFNINHYTENE